MNFTNEHRVLIAIALALFLLAIFGPQIFSIWTMARLKIFLYKHDVLWKYWGTELGAKTLEDLLKAIKSGEIIPESRGMMQQPLLNKYIVVISVWCKRGGKWLLLREFRESGPTNESSVRPHGTCSLSEKVRTRHETCLDAVSRGLQKKLRFLDSYGFTLEEGGGETGPIIDSVSYPSMSEADHIRHYRVVLTEKSRRYEGHYEFRERENGPLTDFRWMEHPSGPPESCLETENEPVTADAAQQVIEKWCLSEKS